MLNTAHDSFIFHGMFFFSTHDSCHFCRTRLLSPAFFSQDSFFFHFWLFFFFLNIYCMIYEILCMIPLSLPVLFFFKKIHIFDLIPDFTRDSFLVLMWIYTWHWFVCTRGWLTFQMNESFIYFYLLKTRFSIHSCLYPMQNFSTESIIFT